MKRPNVSRILKKVAPLLGAKVHLEPEYGFVGYVQFKDGRRTFFNNTSLNINGHGSVKLVKDKGFTNYFLKKFGYNVPACLTIFSEERNRKIAKKRGIVEGLAFCRKVGYPVIIKPNDQSKGLMVVKATNGSEFKLAARRILSRFPVALVERFHRGKDYRIIVLDGEVISAYRRIPLCIVGDGRHTIAHLLAAKQHEFDALQRDAHINPNDFRIALNLKRNNLKPSSILEKGRRVRLLENANLSTGGESVDLTTSIHNDYKQLCVSVARDFGLRLAGIDILTSDITKALDEGHVIIEVNGAPGLDNFAAKGKQQRRAVEQLYLKVLRALEKQK
jgi:D-alanine-D-alanine ligase-like ATP-grasp enzyme